MPAPPLITARRKSASVRMPLSRPSPSTSSIAPTRRWAARRAQPRPAVSPAPPPALGARRRGPDGVAGASPRGRERATARTRSRLDRAPPRGRRGPARGAAPVHPQPSFGWRAPFPPINSHQFISDPSIAPWLGGVLAGDPAALSSWSGASACVPAAATRARAPTSRSLCPPSAAPRPVRPRSYTCKVRRGGVAGAPGAGRPGRGPRPPGGGGKRRVPSPAPHPPASPPRRSGAAFGPSRRPRCALRGAAAALRIPPRRDRPAARARVRPFHRRRLARDALGRLARGRGGPFAGRRARWRRRPRGGGRHSRCLGCAARVPARPLSVARIPRGGWTACRRRRRSRWRPPFFAPASRRRAPSRGAGLTAHP